MVFMGLLIDRAPARRSSKIYISQDYARTLNNTCLNCLLKEESATVNMVERMLMLLTGERLFRKSRGIDGFGSIKTSSLSGGLKTKSIFQMQSKFHQLHI